MFIAKKGWFKQSCLNEKVQNGCNLRAAKVSSRSTWNICSNDAVPNAVPWSREAEATPETFKEISVIVSLASNCRYFSRVQSTDVRRSGWKCQSRCRVWHWRMRNSPRPSRTQTDLASNQQWRQKGRGIEESMAQVLNACSPESTLCM